MGNNIKTIVYITTNKNNGKIYIGVHDTDPDQYDYYIGNGMYANRPNSWNDADDLFHRAVRKHGANAFERETLAIFDNREDALKLEAMIVNEEFLKREDVYNTCLGGGDPPDSSIPIYQYDLDGNFVREYPSMHHAEIALNGKDTSKIWAAASYKTISFGHYWSKEKHDKIDPNTFSTVRQSKTVYEYDLTGKFVKEYESMSKAISENNVSLGVLQRAIIEKNKCNEKYFSLDFYETFPIKETINKYEHRNKPVYQYDLDGNFIKEWKNTSEVVNELGSVFKYISRSISLRRTCGGYQWTWTKEARLAKARINVPKKVGQYDLDGNLVKIWDSVRDCRKEFGNVSKVLRGYDTKTKGYTFKYIDDIV